MSDYWEKYWNLVSLNIDEQSQVGRTVKKEPISNDIFEKTFDWVSSKMQINKESDILELCCGNGVWTIPFAERVKHITAVDFSKPLLDVLKNKCISKNIKNVDIKLQNVSKINNSDYKFKSHVFLYFAIQHFSERQTISLFETAHRILKDTAGERRIFYIGDIPDREKLWDFANTKEYAKMYFDSIKNETPAIGTWFIKNDLIKLADYAGFSKCEIIEQPSWQINSSYRFDMKLEA
jgi:ubiquinone/menaquinone biosynthesis C-methylase UbiE